MSPLTDETEGSLGWDLDWETRGEENGLAERMGMSLYDTNAVF